jgi:hypothetical protein
MRHRPLIRRAAARRPLASRASPTLVAALAAVSAALFLPACGDDDGGDAPPPPPVDAGVDMTNPCPRTITPAPDPRRCPGDPECPDTGDGVLRVGAAREAFTPVIDESTEILTLDVNGDGEYDPSQGDTFRDVNGNGRFDGEWIAGFGNARGAQGVHDDLWASVIALEQNQTRVALLSLDTVGFFMDDADGIRERVAAMGVDVDYVLFASTHTHEGRDTVGLWGLSATETGLSRAFQDRVKDRAALAVKRAFDDLAARGRGAHVQYARFRTRDLEGGVWRYQGDLRDPIVIDDEVNVLRFIDPGATSGPGDDATIATLVQWSSHPEYAGPRNVLLSSDFAHALREGVSGGVDFPDDTRDRPGVGGLTVFFQGILGSQIGPNQLEVVAWGQAADPDAGVASDPAARPPVPRDTLPYGQVVGAQIAFGVLSTLAADGAVSAEPPVTDETARLGFALRQFFVPVENRAYHLGLNFGIFSRSTYNWARDCSITTRNLPDVLTEVTVVDIGRARIVTFPGELVPSLWIGGYRQVGGVYPFTPDRPDGRAVDIVDPGNENPPRLDMAPEGPYLRDITLSSRGTGEGRVEYPIPFGLASDYLGYFIPEYDYVLSSRTPYFEEAPGDHYEETNSIGPRGWPIIEENVRALLTGSAP